MLQNKTYSTTFNNRDLVNTILDPLCYLALLGGFFVWPSYSYSNDTSSELNAFTEEDMFTDIPIVLSAARMPQPTKDAPASITVITRKMIEASGAIEIADVFRLVPGFQVSHVNGNSFAVTYHGMSYDFPRKLQVLVDGRSVYRPLLSNVDWANLGIALSDIERIEIIRGPNTPVFGTNAFSGTINIITREPFQDNGFNLHLTSGSQDMQQSILNYAVNDNGFSFRSTVGYRHDEGFEHVDDERQLVMASFRGVYDMNSTQSLDMQFGYSGGEMGAGGDGSLLSPIRNKEITSYYGHIRFKETISANNEYYVQLYHNYYEQNDQFLVGPLSSSLGLDPAQVPIVFGGQPDQLIQTGVYDGLADRTDLEFQYLQRPWPDLRFVWGGSLRRDRIKGQHILDQHDYVEDISQRVFTNIEWRTTPVTVFNVGMMIEDNDIVGRTTSPRVAFNYALNAHQTFRLSATKAYRSPSLYEANNLWTLRFNDGDLLYTLYDHDQKLEPEELVSYELGYIMDIKDPALLFDLKIFKERLRKFIGAPEDSTHSQPVFLIDVSGTDTKVWSNGGQVDTDGIEAQLNYRPSTETLVNINYSYANATGKLAEIINPVAYESLDDNLPRHTMSMLIDHQWKNYWRSSVAYYYMDKIEWGGDGDYLDGYSRWDMRVAKALRINKMNVSLSLSIQNLLNRAYNEFRVENEYERRLYLQLKFSEQ